MPECFESEGMKIDLYDSESLNQTMEAPKYFQCRKEFLYTGHGIFLNNDYRMFLI